MRQSFLILFYDINCDQSMGKVIEGSLFLQVYDSYDVKPQEDSCLCKTDLLGAWAQFRWTYFGSLGLQQANW